MTRYHFFPLLTLYYYHFIAQNMASTNEQHANAEVKAVKRQRAN